MGRQENVRIFEDTQRLYENDPRLRDAVSRSIEQQKLITERMKYPCHSGERRYENDAEIVVSGRRSFAAAMRYSGKKVCVLNFASATNPGGGVTRGSTAQEECLCRCSTLFAALDSSQMWSGFYTPHRCARDPLHNDDCIYTPDVVVFKSDTDEPRLQPERMWYTVDVLTCAAPNLRERPGNHMNPGDGDRSIDISADDLLWLHEKRLRRVADIAVENGAQVLILGAFGCGAFRNPPKVVAQAMKTVVEEYRHCFQTIEMAVYCPPRDDTNYRVFSEMFGKK